MDSGRSGPQTFFGQNPGNRIALIHCWDRKSIMMEEPVTTRRGGHGFE
jgi:hypothetical protein